jgi:hypothetical protein
MSTALAPDRAILLVERNNLVTAALTSLKKKRRANHFTSFLQARVSTRFVIAPYIRLRLVAVSETSFITHFAIHTIACPKREG